MRTMMTDATKGLGRERKGERKMTAIQQKLHCKGQSFVSRTERPPSVQQTPRNFIPDPLSTTTGF